MIKKILNLKFISLNYRTFVALIIFAAIIIAEIPQWVGDPIPLKANGVDIKATYNAKEPNYVPALGDWDNDGDLDLFIAEDNYAVTYNGQKGTEPRVFLYENIGNSKKHLFAKRVRIEGVSRVAYVPDPAG